MIFNIITIFPQIFESYFNVAMIKRAQLKKIIQVKITDLRHYADNKYQSVDDTPYGGGAGMVLKIEPIYKALKSIKRKKKSRVILFSARGKTLAQKDLQRLKKYDQLIMICGRYEGVDNRVAEHLADEEISIGNYVLTGGEIPAMILVDGITRLLPGVLGNLESPKDESFTKEDELEYPQYTKPEKFKTWKVPEVLLSGHHGKIKEWREKQKKRKP
ncbi:MAG: tRNA (guanosine(37)-N1)-methyltransferase TrmD [Candidatus Buchananbacteria bacterium RBG_13_39_9]|uniref:tRNA (guanine-N(1)-)-methyltransferase n=1 Tax=Candidatus Buchananbacteria bacterium RBG_13_39_9 TaxID=1797531 RepID=A0A1G1XPK3_9BACT|nr:MAG: tRNA (guanosine(37)-N1)-methyltransferase TrmD [Candidatus Buchananbacteria bacterium RBG_13_39_9]